MSSAPGRRRRRPRRPGRARPTSSVAAFRSTRARPSARPPPGCGYPQLPIRRASRSPVKASCTSTPPRWSRPRTSRISARSRRASTARTCGRTAARTTAWRRAPTTGPGSPLSEFAGLVIGTLGRREGAIAMNSLASPTGYLDVAKEAIDARVAARRRRRRRRAGASTTTSRIDTMQALDRPGPHAPRRSRRRQRRSRCCARRATTTTTCGSRSTALGFIRRAAHGDPVRRRRHRHRRHDVLRLRLLVGRDARERAVDRPRPGGLRGDRPRPRPRPAPTTITTDATTPSSAPPRRHRRRPHPCTRQRLWRPGGGHDDGPVAARRAKVRMHPPVRPTPGTLNFLLVTRPGSSRCSKPRLPIRPSSRSTRRRRSRTGARSSTGCSRSRTTSILYVLQIVSEVVAVISWFAILFTGKLPEGLAGFQVMYLRYTLRTYSYIGFLREEYPPFTFATTPADPGDDPRVRVDVQPQLTDRNRSRCSSGSSWSSRRPSCWRSRASRSYVVSFIAFFVVLFTGQVAAGHARLRRQGGALVRCACTAYGLLLTDVYPPFALD